MPWLLLRCVVSHVCWFDLWKNLLNSDVLMTGLFPTRSLISATFLMRLLALVRMLRQ